MNNVKAPKVYLKTYGCQMNERDTEAVAVDMQSAGYEVTNDENLADVILFNTCSVRDQAERKALGKIGLIKKLKEKKPNIQVGFMGCMAQSRGATIAEKYTHIDLVTGPDQMNNIPQLLKTAKKDNKQIVKTEFNRAVEKNIQKHVQGKVSAYINIMFGCNEYCTYCIVPFTRGQEKSRRISSIIAEVKELSEKGVREITFLGQNITAYGIVEERKARSYAKYAQQSSPFAELLRETAKIDKIKRIRFTSPHARYFNDDLVETIAAEPKICRHIHLPLQSGSNRILKMMRRRYTAEEFLSWANKLKSAIPDLAIGTDIIVGFPGETEQDFQATRDLCNTIGFSQQFIFRYSQRYNTPAAKMANQLPDDIKKERNQILLSDLAARNEKCHQELVGTCQEILVEGPSKKNDLRWSGRTSQNKIVIFEPDRETQAGSLLNIDIKDYTNNSLYGMLLPK